MSLKYVEPIVKKLSKKIGKIIDDQELQSLQKDILGSSFDKNKFYKLIFILKQRQYLIPLKKDLYLVSYPENKSFTLTNSIDKLYRELLYKQIKKECKTNYYIGWSKGLELHLNNYDIPNEIEVYNEKNQGREQVISDYYIYYKYYSQSKKISLTQKPLFKKIQASRITLKVGNNNFQVGCVEVCLLESLYYKDQISSYHTELIKKVIKKFREQRNRDLIKHIISSWRHHTSINRLYEMSKSVDPSFANSCLNIIRTYWFKMSL